MKRSLLIATLVVATVANAQTAPRIGKVSPFKGPSSGGTRVAIEGEGFLREAECLLPCPTTVWFGNLEVPVKAVGPNGILAIAPAHAPGVVDLTVNVPGKPPVVQANGFEYLPTPEDDFEHVLLPIYLDAPANGAFGARWKTDLWMRNSSVEAVDFAAWPCSAEVCTAAVPTRFALAGGRSLHNLPPLSGAPDGNPSRVLYIEKSQARNLSFNLRLSDTSRSLIDGGVEMPVVREAELLDRTAQLFDVPLTPGFRVLLRVYDLAYSSSSFSVLVYPQAESADQPIVYWGQIQAAAVDEGEFASKSAYASIDITSLLREPRQWPENARIEIVPLTPGSRFWAFASITNNDTQIVTLVTPQ
jgi:hypothetical protein